MKSSENTVFNKSEYKIRRQQLRNEMTEPEKRMWKILRNNQLGVKFRRQHGVGHYIVDFYCSELKLVIEIDGHSHFSTDAQEYDLIREAFMHTLGITTLRFTNNEVIEDIEGIHQQLTTYIDSLTELLREN